jgi:O-antigen/teichoic acid export membrane protein
MLMTGRTIAFAVTFVAPPILARAFSQSDFGTYKQFLLITYTLFGFGQFGLAECLFYFMPARPERSGRYALNSLVMLGGMGALFSIALFFGSSFVTSWVKNPALREYLPLAGPYLTLMLMGTVLEISMICRKAYRAATATYVASDVLKVVALIIPALLTHNLMWTLIGSLIFCILRVAAILVYFRKEFASELRFDFSLLKEQLSYALPFTGAIIIYIIQQNYHQYAVSYYFDAATFAIYSVGCLQIPLVDLLSTPTSNVMMVQMGGDIREGRLHRLLPVWHETTRRMALIFFPMCGLLIVNASHLITLLFTSAYAASIPIFMVWSISILFAAFQTDSVLRVFAQNRTLILINLVRLAAIALSINWLLSKFHLIGAVMVTLAGILIAKTMALIRIKSLLQASMTTVLPWKNLGTTLMVAMLAAIPALFVNAKLDAPGIVVLPLCGMAYMISYSILTFAFGLLSESERAALKKTLYVWNRRSAESEPEAGI